MTFRKSDKKTLKHFHQKDIPVHIKRTDHKGQEVRFIETGCQSDDCPLVVFVHGAPGGADAYFSFLEDSTLMQKARLISVDRLGYGYSAYGQSEVSISEQSAQLETVIQQYTNPSVVLVGHSYGGTIIGRYAIDNPDRVRSTFMIAPVNDPDSEKVFWFANIGRWWLTKWTLSKAFRVSADEKLAHVGELKKMLPDWEKITVPVVHMHGKKDMLASFENIAFSKRHIPEHLLKTIELEKGNHLLIWNQYEMVRDEILMWLD